MNIQIIANGRTVFIADCHGAPEDCAGIALDVWQQTEPDKPEEITAGFGFTTETNTPVDQPAYLGYGERPITK